MATIIGGVSCERINPAGVLGAENPDRIAWLLPWDERFRVIAALIHHPVARHPDKPEMFCRSIDVEGKGSMQAEDGRPSFTHALILATYSDKPLTLDLT